MPVYKFLMPRAIYDQLVLTKTNYINRQEAIDDLKKAFEEKNFKFTIEEQGNKTCFYR